MPISDSEEATIISKLIEIIKELRQENAALVELLLKKSGDIQQEEEIRVEIPEYQRSFGREPWYIRKTRLENEHRKPKLSEISGIPDQEKTQ